MAVFYTVICIGVVQTALVGGSAGTRADDETSKEYTARVLNWPLGRVLVGLFGAVLVIVGVVIVVRSLMRKFEENLRTGEMNPTTRRVVAGLGIVGGVVAAVAGLFVLLAAVQFDPGRAKGLDETLRSFAATPAGPVLLIAAAASSASDATSARSRSPTAPSSRTRQGLLRTPGRRRNPAASSAGS